MYDINYYKAHNYPQVLAFMHANPFAIVCGITANHLPIATHLPMIIEERNNKIFLLAHAMRKQNHTEAFLQNPNVLVIFSGANSYVSATNYEQPNTASTYNYSAVHAQGIIKVVDDMALLNMLKKLTHQFEQNPSSPALVEKMDESYVTTHMKAIVGFEIEITALDHVFKLSQNKNQETRNKIIETLTNSNTQSQEMAKTMSDFYK